MSEIHRQEGVHHVILDLRADSEVPGSQPLSPVRWTSTMESLKQQGH